MTREKSSWGYGVETIHSENIAYRKDRSPDDKPNGWYIGPDDIGPFDSVEDVYAGSDATAVVARKNGGFMETVIVDGKECGTYNNCHQIPTASKKLLLRATHPEPNVEFGDGRPHLFLLHKKGIHGPLTDMKELHTFAKGVFVANVVGKPGTYDKHLFFDESSYGSVYSTQIMTDVTGAKYLICYDSFHKPANTRIVTTKNLMVECDEWHMSEGVLISTKAVRGKKETSVFLGGVVVSTHTDSGVEVWPIGRHVLQCVRTKDSSGKSKAALVLDRVQAVGPYDAITRLTVDGNFVTYTSHETDNYGVRTITLRKFLVSEH